LLKRDLDRILPETPMAHRQITDNEERVWDVWEVTTPMSTTRRVLVQADLQAGWLAFQCGEKRRRLAPLPTGWTQLSDSDLLGLMDQARPIEPRAVRIR
jgi:hypothetical protein